MTKFHVAIGDTARACRREGIDTAVAVATRATWTAGEGSAATIRWAAMAGKTRIEN